MAKRRHRTKVKRRNIALLQHITSHKPKAGPHTNRKRERARRLCRGRVKETS